MKIIKLFGTGINLVNTIFNNFIIFFSRLPFLYVGWLVAFYLYLGSEAFTTVNSQTLQIQNTIMFLGLFSVSMLFFGFLIAPNLIKKNFIEMSGFKGLLSFVLSFFVCGLVFTSMKGTVDIGFMKGLFKDFLFIAIYMFLIALFEETIFRFGMLEMFKKISPNPFVAYFIGALLFSLFHIPAYSGSFGNMFMAFIIGLLLCWLMDFDCIGGLPTFPMAVAFHMTYNLSCVGALDLMFKMVGL